ncbi:hypothetical protein Tco_1154253 [Tanacetum coccineum]
METQQGGKPYHLPPLSAKDVISDVTSKNETSEFNKPKADEDVTRYSQDSTPPQIQVLTETHKGNQAVAKMKVIKEESEALGLLRIDTNIFHFKTPLCEAFKEFNYLLKIDVDVLTNDIPRFKTYDEYKDAWIYEWNKDVPWVANMPWLDYGPWMEPCDDIKHICKPFCFKNGHAEWPTCNWKMEKYGNGGDLPEVIHNGDVIYFESYEWYENLKEGEFQDEALNSKAIFERSKGDINDHAGTNNDCKIQKDEGWFDEHRLMGDDNDDIGDLEDYLIRKDSPYYVNKEEERSKERRCKLLGIPYVKPPTCKSEMYKVVKIHLDQRRNMSQLRNTNMTFGSEPKKTFLKSTKIFYKRRTKDGL